MSIITRTGSLHRSRLAFLPHVLVVIGAAQALAAATINVPNGGDLQGSLNAASPGDAIVLQAGATYTGNFILPLKPGTGTITIRSSAAASLPPDGTRIQPSDAQYMAKIVTTTADSALSAQTQAHGYRITGLEITTAATTQTTDLVRLGAYETSAADLPHDFLLDHNYIHGGLNGVKHGISLNGAQVQIRDSQISDIFSTIDESHAIAGWNGSGPYQIVNNRLEATGIVILFGGGLSTANVVASDVLIQGNYLHKPLSFNTGAYFIKNLIELKKAQRVTITGNILENDWQGGQWCLVISVYHDGNPTADVHDVSIIGNRFRNCARGIDVSGTEAPAYGITIQGNLLYDIPSTTMLLLGSLDNVNINQNTIVTQADMDLGFDVALTTHLSVTNNVMFKGTYGVKGSGSASGTATLAAFAPGAIFTGNIVVGVDSSTYPPGNSYPTALSLISYKLPVGSYSAGPDIDSLNASLANVVVGQPSGSSISCDLNSDGKVNVLDVQLATNQVLGYATCGAADLTGDGQCTVVDVQRIISASFGATCHLGL